MERFKDETESAMWLEIFVAQRASGASVEYAAKQADDSLVPWRERNPDGFNPARSEQ